MPWTTLLTLAVPPLLFVNTAYVTPTLRTHRHGLAGALSLMSGSLLAAAQSGVGEPGMLFWLGCGALALMGLALFWRPR